MPETPAQLGERMAAVLQTLNPDTDGEVRPHLIWTARQIMSKIGPEEFTTPELAAFVAVLIPIHSRILIIRNPPPRVERRTVLRSVP